jgi:hypothetical protein
MVQSFWNLRYRNLGFRPGFGNTTSNVQRFVGRERQPSAWAAARQPEYGVRRSHSDGSDVRRYQAITVIRVTCAGYSEKRKQRHAVTRGVFV